MYGTIANDPKYIQDMDSDAAVKKFRSEVYESVIRYRYTYNFTWLGRPIIQLPQDMVAIQEIIWDVKPEVIIETGIAHGGSLMLSASVLELLGGDGVVVGIDIDIREHNRNAIEAHTLFQRIKMIKGSSTDPKVVAKVGEICRPKRKTMVLLDSDHTHNHVRKELESYSPFVTKGSYLIVFDTLIEDVADEFFNGRPWGKGNNPKTAVREFLKSNDRFEIDLEFERKLLFTVAPGGYLKCVKD